jgi:hypothetical protein
LKAVWSLWTLPYRHHNLSRWLSQKYEWLSWILSVETYQQHFNKSTLYTDDAGAKILIDELGLEFSYVSTCLNSLKSEDPSLWALGKIYTYQLQTEPFVHIDSDVFLWKPLPKRLLEASLFAQNEEPFDEWDGGWYQPSIVEACIESIEGGWIPTEWKWYREVHAEKQKGICCGIFGGNAIDFITYYAKKALKMVSQFQNKKALLWLPNKDKHIVLFEQFLLSCCYSYSIEVQPNKFSGLFFEFLLITYTL